MFRWLTLFAAVALVAVGAVFYLYGGAPNWLVFAPPQPVVERPPDKPAPPPGKKADAAPLPDAGPPGPWTRDAGVMPSVVIAGARLTAIHTPQVPSMRDGQLLFLGTEWKGKPGEAPPGAFKQEMHYLITEARAGDATPKEDLVLVGDKWYRPLARREDAKPNNVRLYHAEKWFLPVDEGTKVQEGQLLGVIDPSLAVDDLDIKLAKLDAAEADRAASEKTRDESKTRYERAYELWRKGSESKENVDAAKLTWDRYTYETVNKTEAVKTASKELRQAETVLDLHLIRSKINGQVKVVVRHKGEAVKNLDPVLDMVDVSKFRVRGHVDRQDLTALRQAGDDVFVETTRMVAPRPDGILRGHMGEVTGVAVSKDDRVVSVSEDRTARVWDLKRGSEAVAPLRHPAAVRAVACTSTEAKENYFLTGAADGVARLYNLADPGVPKVRDFSGGHKEAITSVALSPDGRWAVTGGEDRAICLWDVGSGDVLHRFPADEGHHGGVTSVQFLGVGTKKKLSVVSAGRDNALIVWPLTADGAPEKAIRLDRRGGEVTTLGVNQTTGQLLFDQGKELRILSAENAALNGTLSQTGSASFSRLALFSPDGKLVLASGGSGRLQLWRAPTAETRGHELEQLVWTSKDEQATTTSGAFAPDGAFLVTGTSGRNVIVWPMPGKDEVEKHLTAKVINLDPEVSSGQVRVTAELDNPGYLLAGDVVNLVVYPPKK